MKKIAVPSEDRSNVNKENLLFFNQIFDKKRLKALISWVFKQSGEAEALRIIDILKETGFKHATKAGISIGLHDLATPIQKAVLISESQLAIATTDRDFSGAKITATERSQRIIDTWHRASESLSKQVVDYFAIYDRFNPVYIMALSGARGNFSQVRQLIGMRGLMADQQGKIVNFPIQSNLREGLTLTEYFISCSGARKGLVDTALRTADTGYLTRRLVDVSHHVVVKKVRCNTTRALAFRSLQSYNKVLLPLKERLVGRVLSENIFISEDVSRPSTFYEAKSPFFLYFQGSNLPLWKQRFQSSKKPGFSVFAEDFNGDDRSVAGIFANKASETRRSLVRNGNEGVTNRSELITLDEGHVWSESNGNYAEIQNENKSTICKSPCPQKVTKLKQSPKNKAWNRLLYADRTAIAQQDQEISLKLALKIAKVREQVFLRSPLTCGFTHSVCQLCYGWSISQGSLVSLGDAVGVIAAQSIGEPGTQLTMRTFHTGGVFSGDLLQEIRAPHAGKITFSKAFGGLLIRTAHGHLAFLSKSEGSLYISNDEISNEEPRSRLLNPDKTVIPIPAFSLLFIRQGEKVSTNQLLAEFSIRTKEGAQPIKTQQTIYAELSGIIVEDCSGKVYTKRVKESALLLDLLDSQSASPQSSYLDFPKVASVDVSQDLPMTFKEKYRQQRSQNVKGCSHKKKDVFASRKKLCFVTPSYGTPIKLRTKNKLSKKLDLRESKGHTNYRFVSHAHERSYVKGVAPPGHQIENLFLNKPSKYKSWLLRASRICEANKAIPCTPELCKQKRSVPKQIFDLLVPYEPYKASLWKLRKQSFALLPLSFWKLRKQSFSLLPLSCTKGVTSKALPLRGIKSEICKPCLRSFVCSVAGSSVSVESNGGDQTRLANLDSKESGFLNRRFVSLVRNTVGDGLVSQTKRSFARKHFGSKICKKSCLSCSYKKGGSSSICKAQTHPNEDIENDLFSYVEPAQSGRLGFLKILSTRVGATLDYNYPIKSIDYPFVKKNKIHEFKKDCYYTSLDLANSKLFCFRLSPYVPVNFMPPKGHVLASQTKVIKQGFKKPGTLVPSLQMRTKLCFVRSATKANQFLQSSPEKDFEEEQYQNLETSPLKNKTFQFFLSTAESKYLHPESIKENRFLLQTIAEYGDIVDETYKKKVFNF